MANSLLPLPRGKLRHLAGRKQQQAAFGVDQRDAHVGEPPAVAERHRRWRQHQGAIA
jgi:hypothetical protein